MTSLVTAKYDSATNQTLPNVNFPAGFSVDASGNVTGLVGPGGGVISFTNTALVTAGRNVFASNLASDWSNASSTAPGHPPCISLVSLFKRNYHDWFSYL